MSNYLSNLATTVIHPGGGVHPRLPGRFEPQHLALAGALDFVAADDAGHEAPAPPVQPAQSPGNLAALSADAPTPGDRLHDSLAPSITPAPPPASPPQPDQAAAAGSEAVPETPAVPVSPALQPTPKLPAVEGGQRPDGPDETGLLSPASAPDTLAASTGSTEPRPTPERRPAEWQPVQMQLPAAIPAILPEVRPSSMPVSPAPARPTAPDAKPFPLEPASRTATSVTSLPQIKPAGTEPAIVEAAQRPPAEPLLGWADGRATVEPHFQQPMAEMPPRRADADQTPTIRVTIGRIEVRATMPPAPPARPQPVRRQPALPLDQYLQRRNEGKR